MKKHKRSTRAAGRKTKNQTTTAEPADKSRRRFFGTVRNGAIAVLAVGGGGLFFVQHVRSSMHEHDLSRIGNGTATVVQIHDPNCSMCLDLQRQTRKALKEFDDDEIDYVVANIRSAEGSQFAQQHRVQHVTLLLFDATGDLKATLRGQRRSAELAQAFRSIVPN